MVTQSTGVSPSSLSIPNRPSHFIQMSLWALAFPVVIRLQPLSLPVPLAGKFCTMFDLEGSSCLLSSSVLLFKGGVISIFYIDFGLVSARGVGGLGRGSSLV